MIPPAEERAALTAALRELIAEHGHSDFLFGPILTASHEHFPDAWRPDRNGAAAMLRRLLWWHRMGDVPFTLDAYDAETTVEVQDDHGSRFVRPVHSVAAWFAGREGKTLRFGIDVKQLKSPESLAGVLAHEVAHAWRLVHDEWVTERSHEEQLTDVTTVFLGCGVLTCNNAQRHYSGTVMRGDTPYHQFGWESFGYLPPHGIAWLLALQLHARGDRKEISRIGDALERNQRASLREGLDLLAKEGVDLGLPPREQWIPAAALPALAPLELALIPVPPGPTELAPAPPASAIAFRVPGSRRLAAFFGGLFALPFAYAAASSMHAPWVLSATLIGAVLGFVSQAHTCSACEKKVGATDDRCGVCNARLVGNIARRRDRAEAERDWLLNQTDVESRARLSSEIDFEQEALKTQREE